MEVENLTTTVTEFVLLGLTQSPELKYLLFLVFFLVYLMTWLSNLTIIIVVITNSHLHIPMYFFLANLAFIDINDSSVTAVKLLWDLASQTKTISFTWCIIQIFLFHFTGGAGVFLLVVMAVDRYVVIHKPLHYLTIMNQGVCTGLVIGSWLGGFAHSIVQTALIIQLPFCGPNILDNFYCDVPQVIKLACVNTYLVELLMVSNSGLLLAFIFLILLISYSIILVKIRKHVTDGKHKALSTCAVQIIGKNLIFIPEIFIYDRPFKKLSVDKIVSVTYALITPMLNPIIYTLRNAEMKNAIWRLMRRILFSRRK
ncbi:olfactory receptor 4D9-like [Alligator mississippiensis]|uniref:olfactory receptor 4D9-like n=1 Tax=Alligator mississippiensis TaxID=8496 RepID=UPI0003D0C7DB|nr:olfactory receptor 4D9-like [Alligator mississippiensis]